MILFNVNVGDLILNKSRVYGYRDNSFPFFLALQAAGVGT